MAGAEIEILGGEHLDQLGTLEQLAESIFGRGAREPGWFARKLVREGVEPGLSALALEGDVVCGYALLGRAPSLGAVARGAGVGLVAAARGQGLGRKLIEFASARARAAGCAWVEFLAEPARLDWYLGQGFAGVAAQLSLLGYGLGGGEPVVAGRSLGVDVELGPAPLWSWVPEAWARTPARQRALVELPHGRVWMTREGRAWLAHRLERTGEVAVPELLLALQRRVQVGTPLILYPCDADAAWVGELLASGFEVAQRSQVVRRSTGPAGEPQPGRP